MANGGRQFIEQVVTDTITDRVTGARRVVAAAPPAAGTWAVGDIVFNSAPPLYGSPGWICVGAGTPGTWLPMSAPGEVDTVAHRDAMSSDELVNGEVIWVVETSAFYKWDSTAVAWEWFDTGRALGNRGAWVVAGTCYVDSVAGDDDTGTGLVGAPYQTLVRCIADIGVQNPALLTIQVVSGSALSIPGSIYDLSYVMIQGTTTVFETATWISNTLASEADGVVVNVTGLNGGADAYKGRLIVWTAGALNGRYGWIYRNDATDTYVAGETRCYISYSGTTFAAPNAGSTFNVLTMDSSLIVDGTGTSGTSINSASIMSISFLRIAEVGGAYTKRLAIPTMNRVVFNECSFGIKEFGGCAQLICCYCNNRTASGASWIFYVSSVMLMGQGTVFDGTGAVANGRVLIAYNTMISTTGQVVFTGAWQGVQFEDCDVNVGRLTATTYTAVDAWFFDPGSLSAAGVTINGTRAFGSYYLPNLYGQISGNYAVTATNGARVKLGASSALVTALGAGYNNAVRGDGTNPTCCGPDGTQIQGGYPSGWVLVNAGTGISPAFQNLWAVVATWQAPAFRLTPDGFCHLDGNIGGGNNASIAFTLPAGYRPTTQHVFSVYANASTADVANVLVAANGDVTITGPGGLTTNIGLSGIHFPVAAAL
jgi:hypothetical protein